MAAALVLPTNNNASSSALPMTSRQACDGDC